MTSIETFTDPRAAPPTFSLRTLFLFVTTSGVFFAVLRVGNGFFAASGSLAFLWVWWLFTDREQLATYAAIAAFVSLLLGALMFVPSATDRGGHRMQCMNNLKQIGLALLAYQQRYGSFPPAYVADANGKLLYSWRVLILPFLDQGNLRNAIRSDEAWNGPNNSKVTQKGLLVFGCPSDVRSGSWPSAMTSYVAVVGPNTAWSGTTPRKLSEFKNPGGTILVVEIANSGIHWAEPRDLYIGQMPLAIDPPSGQGISSHHTGGANAVFVDGSVHSLDNSISPKTLAELLDLDGCSDPSAY